MPNKIVAVAVATVYGFTFMALGFSECCVCLLWTRKPGARLIDERG